MDTRTTERRKERIDRILSCLEDRWEAEDLDLLQEFVRAFYRTAPPADLLTQAPETLCGAAVAMWRFGETRRPGPAQVRIYRPTLAEHGWHSPHTVVEIVGDDMAFLVDSVTAELQRLDAEVRLVLHPILDVRRNDEGRVTALEAGAGSRRESWMQVHLRSLPLELHEMIARALEAVLSDVRVVIEDRPALVSRTRDLAVELRGCEVGADPADLEESAAFLEWLVDDNFTLLGYREYAFEGEDEDAVGRVVSGSDLGLLRDAAKRVFAGMLGGGRLPPDVRHFLKESTPVRITKGNRHSTVHRPVLLDTVAVKRYDEHGAVVGGGLLVGLFTSRAYTTNPLDIPILRGKVRGTLQRAGIPAETHDGRVLLHILTTYPRDELFQISAAELGNTALGILDLQERPRTALFVRVDLFERFVSCLVYVPRDRYDTRFRVRVQELLTDAWQGTLKAFYTHLADSPLARVHFVIETRPGELPDVDLDALEAQIAEAGRSWTDRLADALVDAHGEEEGSRLLTRYQDAFPTSYRDHFHEQEAVADIARVEAAMGGDGLALNLYRALEAPARQLRFKLYTFGEPVPLSDVLPRLEHMGFTVLGEVPYRLRLADAEYTAWIRELYLSVPEDQPLDLGRVRDRFHEAFRLVWRGELESDGFNRLVLLAGLSAREVTVIRAYSRFLHQARVPFSQAYMQQTLASQPEIARALADLFAVRFDPAVRAGAEAREQDLVARIRRLLEGVTNLDMDRILRRFLDLVQCTLRTNAFQRDPDGRPKPYLSLKLDSTRVVNLPRPRPHREIFVYSPRMEGVHLRGGKVARGGIRWSDRLEDFRTEVLGLMKAQMIKNTVIVPVGSKGGFVVKRPPAPEAGREALMAEVVECYRTLMRGLLDLTDNHQASAVVPPPDVVRHDEDDPYLVVAADKGTATFSDIANAVAAEYGFWLDDAFASGGSAGYDHKKMGITARGAWECVRRHFREMGKDIQAEDFSVVGVGDMGGDVFGNGMLLSPHIRLVGAFNHQHVFVDPDPDPAASFAERQRLFDLPRSSWADYDPSAISEGGGVWERSRKSIPLSPRMKALFGLDVDETTPSDLMHAMLQADVGLLWFGGIGTFVKATSESHADVGDRANDAVRIDASLLRAGVVGEGANLALTQRARIEAATKGVRLNTDALDNSAGVDCSDHEVNIKILLGELERKGDLTRKRRNRLLEDMTEEVGRLVLRDNYLQSQALTVAQQAGPSLVDRMGRFMRALAKEGRLDRALEFLPDDEALAERRKARRGLTRPELAVLLSYAKLVLYDELLPSSLPDEPWMEAVLLRYFPQPLQQGHPNAIRRHRLRREIVATQVTNGLLNRVGIAFVHEVREKTGLGAPEIARAYLAAKDVLGMPALWAEIEALDNHVPASLQATLLAECARIVEQVVVWLLREEAHPLDVPALVEAYRSGVEDLIRDLDTLLPESHRLDLERQTEALVAQGAPEALARRVAGLETLESACDVVRIATRSGVAVPRAAEVFHAVGDAFGFDWLHRAAGRLPADTAWEKLAVGAMVDDLYGHQAALAASVLEVAGAGVAATDAIEAWSATRVPQVARTRQLLAELQGTARPDLSMLTVAGRQLKSMCG